LQDEKIEIMARKAIMKLIFTNAEISEIGVCLVSVGVPLLLQSDSSINRAKNFHLIPK